MKIPQIVSDHCIKHRCGKTCPLECTSPLSPYDSESYQTWLKNICEKIVSYTEGNKR